MSSPTILVVGAGPTGLVLALWLARGGVGVRIVDDGDGPGERSRAMVVHARTLELYHQLGIAAAVVAQGVEAGAARLRIGATGGDDRGHEIAAASFRDLGEGLSPYPFALAYPQDDHERFLVGALREAGVEVEWRTRLVSFVEDGDATVARLERDGREERFACAWLCGADGSHSVVRRTLGIDFVGGTYAQLYYVADVEIEGGFRRDLVVNLGRDALALLLPVRSSGMQRLIGLVPPHLSDRGDLTFDALRSSIEPLVDVRVTRVNWFATYRVHHRVADRFRAGRAFLLGDAGHVHSPVGGQGMNTGIGDAINLAWKLAMVAQGRAPATLLDSYEPERIAFARQLVATTDRAFRFVVAGGLAGRVVRRVLMPVAFRLATGSIAGRHRAFRLVSQIAIAYRDRPLAQGEAGDIAGGDRLPWVAAADNFAPLATRDWQVHVHGDATPSWRDACARHRVALHRFAWSDGASDAGYARDAIYLVRPDGYVALASADADGAALDAYAEARGLRLGP